MYGKIASKTRILISLFKKFKKSHYKEVFIHEDGFFFAKLKEVSGNSNWEKLKSEYGYPKYIPSYYRYTIKENYELNIDG